MNENLKLEPVAASVQMRHELSAIVSGLMALRANIQQRYPASERERRILDTCIGRISKLIETLDHLKSA